MTNHLRNLLPEPTPPDTLLLLPLLQSGCGSTDAPNHCLHPVVADGQLTFCHAATREHCPVCHRPICEPHQLPREIALLDRYSCPTKSSLHFLCETCATLAERAIQLLQVLHLSLNEQMAEDQQAERSANALSAIRCHIEQHAPHLEILGVVYSGSRPLLSVRDTANFDIVVAFGALSDLICYLHYVDGQTPEVLHEF
jgi:hypothetical protein